MILPQVLRIEPASACNLRCDHCPTGVTKMRRTVMKEKVFRRVLEELCLHVPNIRTVVMYHGGEPFLNKQFLSMVRRVKDIGVPFLKTVSNGMLITPDLAEAVVRSGLDAIEISLDGSSGMENDQIRQRSSFKTVVAHIVALARASLSTGTNVTIQVATTQFLNVNSDPDQAPEIPNWLRESLADVQDVVSFKPGWAMLWPSNQPAVTYDIRHDGRPHAVPQRCSLFDETMTIRADGQIVACCYDLTSLSNLGNILTQSLAEIWHGENYQHFREAFVRREFPDLCKGCAIVTGRKFLIPKMTKNNCFQLIPG